MCEIHLAEIREEWEYTESRIWRDTLEKMELIEQQ